jgi:hypothetical protein
MTSAWVAAPGATGCPHSTDVHENRTAPGPRSSSGYATPAGAAYRCRAMNAILGVIILYGQLSVNIMCHLLKKGRSTPYLPVDSRYDMVRPNSLRPKPRTGATCVAIAVLRTSPGVSSPCLRCSSACRSVTGRCSPPSTATLRRAEGHHGASTRVSPGLSVIKTIPPQLALRTIARDQPPSERRRDGAIRGERDRTPPRRQHDGSTPCGTDASRGRSAGVVADRSDRRGEKEDGRRIYP